jgi:hypothetical protein
MAKSTVIKTTDSMTVNVAHYLSYRHLLGYELKSEGKTLGGFARYAASAIGGHLTLALALKWARLGARDHTTNQPYSQISERVLVEVEYQNIPPGGPR